MSAQVGDRFTFKREAYSVVAMSEPIQISPRDYGVTPESVGEVCREGYWCEYLISNKGIILKNLYVNSKDDFYPVINGVEPTTAQKGSTGYSQYMGHHLYKNINVAVKYNGTMILGKDFIKKYYTRTGYQKAWSYQILNELVFKDGKLVETIDHTEAAKKMRAEVDGYMEQNLDIKEHISEIVEACFPEEKNEVWWVK